MKADKAFLVLEEVLPNLASIFNDADGKEIAETLEKAGGKAKVGDTMLAVFPFFVRHKDDLIAITAAMRSISLAEAGEMELAEFVKVLQELMRGEMMLFFTSCVNMVRCM